MNNLEELRKHIDAIDTEILQLLQKRITIMQQIGEEKKVLHKPIRDFEREQQQLSVLEEKAATLHIPKILVRNIWKLFFETSEEIER